MTESFLGNSDHEIRSRKLDLAAERQETFQEAVAEELNAIVLEGRQMLEDSGQPVNELNLELAFLGSMSKVLKQCHYSVRMQFAYATTRELTSPDVQLTLPPASLEDQVPPCELVAAYRKPLMEALRAQLGDFAEDGLDVADFAPEVMAELDKILSMSLQEAAERALEPGLIQPDIINEAFDHFRALARERIEALQKEADTAMNTLGARANESQRELRSDSEAKPDLEFIEECIRTEQIEQAIYHINSIGKSKRTEKLKKILDDAVLRKARNIINTREGDCLSNTLDTINFYSSDPYGKNLMRAALTPDFLEIARLLIASNQLEKAEQYVGATFKSSRIVVKEALNLTHFNHALDMARHGAPAHAIDSYIEQNIHGSDNKDYAKRAALSYIYS